MSGENKQSDVDAAKASGRRRFIVGTVGGLVVGAAAGAAVGSLGFPKTVTQTQTQTETSTTTQTSTQSIPANLIVNIPSTWDMTADVVIIGSGGAGHTAALGALESGLSVIILEKNSVVGGSTALSGGNQWVPGSPVQIAAGITRKPSDVMTYVDSIGGGEQDDSLIQVYLANAPSWISHLQSITTVKFSVGSADQYEFAPGVLPNNGSDTTSPAGSGAALIAALSPIIQTKGAKLYLNSRVTKIYQDATGAVLGVSAVGYAPPQVGSGVNGILPTLTTTSTATSTGSSAGTSWPSTPTGTTLNIKANKGVVIASGGFDWNSNMLLNFMRGPESYAEGVLTNVGDGQMIGAAVGAQLANMNNVSGQTLYLVPNPNGYQGVVAVEDRGSAGKPGAIIVNSQGNRFMDECLGGHLAFRALHEFSPTLEAYANHPAYTIFDSTFQSYYAIAGIAAKAAVPSWVASSSTLAGLAGILGINATQLAATVAAFNTNAAQGVDPVFGRGSTILDTSGGDKVRKDIANPCLAPIATPPFYGLQFFPGMTGTVGGVKTNTSMQVVDWNGNPIPGLYAAGAASAGFWGEGFPGSGSNVGPALCMGWLTGKAIAGQKPSSTITWGGGATSVITSTSSTTSEGPGTPGY